MENFRESTDLPHLFNVSLMVDKAGSLFSSNRNAALSDEFVHYTTIVNIVILCTIVSVFGLFSNVVNMLVLKRLGIQETVNMTLFATAISDFISVATTLWLAICYNPLFLSVDLPFLPLEIQLPTGDVPHVMAVNVTSWLTAFVTFERCICITFPHKVKDIVTPGKAKLVIAFIFVMVACFQIPTYLTSRMRWKFDYAKNQSLLGLVVEERYVMVNIVTVYISNVFGLLVSFTIITACSLILVTQLYRKSKWRQQSVAAPPGNEEVMGNRDRKVMKMVLIVAVVFMICNTPGMVIFIMTAENPERTPAGSLANNYHVAVSFALVFEAVNASVNVFVYYNMSSRYKEMFRCIFCGESGSAQTGKVA